MIDRIHIVTAEYPPRSGGVGDYSALLAAALAKRGVDVHVWSPDMEASVSRNGVRPHALPDRFGHGARCLLEREFSSAPGCVLVQYVANAMGARGANLPFCLWLLRLRGRGHDVRVMFHEPYFYFSLSHPLGNGLAVAQRAMAALLLRAARVVYLSTETWTRYLELYAPRSTAWTTLPVPSTIPAEADPAAVAQWRSRALSRGGARLVGHFGSYGADIARLLEPLASSVLGTRPDVHLLCIGRNSDSFAATFSSRHPHLRDRIYAANMLVPSDLAAALRACDLLIQPYPDGVTTRRTSVMAGLANGVATLTTSGALTEDIWSSTGAVALAAVDVTALAAKATALLDEDAGRHTLAQAGHRVYEERFALHHTVHTLLER